MIGPVKLPTHPAGLDKPSRQCGVLTKVLHLFLTAVRLLAVAILTVLLAPLILPLLVHLPPCRPVYALERISVLILSMLAALAGFRARFGSRDQLELPHPDPKIFPYFLPSPVVRSWASPLAIVGDVVTFDQPGRWMSDKELEDLSSWLEDIARGSMENGVIPSHILFTKKRSVFCNRIVSIAFTDDAPVAFTAMVYLAVRGEVIVHLGLTMIKKSGRGRGLQSRLFKRALVTSLFNFSRLGCTITNIAASPAGIGSVSDYFFDAFPHYAGLTSRSEWHVSVAREVLARYRHEFGCSRNAMFDENTFVVHGSNAEEGGGTVEFVKTDGKPISRYKNPLCNTFVTEVLDLSAGDELFQVAAVDLIGTYFKYNVSGSVSKHQ